MASKQAFTPWELLSAACIALIIPIYLAYIDEGVRNFEWMKKPNEWIIVILVFCVIFFSQYLAYILFLTKEEGVLKISFGFVLGLILIGSGLVEIVLVGRAIVFLKKIIIHYF